MLSWLTDEHVVQRLAQIVARTAEARNGAHGAQLIGADSLF
jgi:hypothetical protein